MTPQEKQEHARSLTIALDKLSRSPKRFSPSAPFIIPLLMVVVSLFAIVCFLIKHLMRYMKTKDENDPKSIFKTSGTSSPEIPTTPNEDRASMATTASMKTRGSLRLNPNRQKSSKPPAVSLYQMKQTQSPGSSNTKSKSNRAARKAIARAARSEANRNSSRDSREIEDNSDDNRNGDNSPVDLSQHSDDTDEIQTSLNQSGMLYATSSGKNDELDSAATSSNQPEVHIVQIRDLEDNLQHSQAAWPQTESEI